MDLLSRELRGKLLVEEFAVLNVKFMSTLCGLCLNFCRVEVVREGFGGLLASLAGLGISRFVPSIVERRWLGDEAFEIVIFGGAPFSPLRSTSFPVFRFGDGDLDEEIHDFRAKVANDSDTVFVLSRGGLEIVGNGGASVGVVLSGSGDSRLSGDPFTRCIQDLGRAVNDFRLPTLSSFGRSSFVSRLVPWPLVSEFPLSLFFTNVGKGATEATR